MLTIIQKSLGSKKEFSIAIDRLLIKETNINKVLEYSVKFENIGFDIVRKSTKAILLLIPLYLALTILNIYVFIDEYNKGTRFPQLLLFIFGILMFGTGLIYSFFQKTETVFLTGGNKEIKLDAKNPNKDSVEKFICDLHQSIKLYYKKQYAVVDSALSEDANVQNFKYLLQIEAIEFSEYDALVNEIKLNKLL